MIDATIQEALQGVFPSIITTVSKENVPNLSCISQAHYVDKEHLAVSWQFFNKTFKNIQENSKFSLLVTSPTTFSMWKINLVLEEIATDGELFDELKTALEAIATMQGAVDIFKLQAIIVGKIIFIEQQFNGRQ